VTGDAPVQLLAVECAGSRAKSQVAVTRSCTVGGSDQPTLDWIQKKDHIVSVPSTSDYAERLRMADLRVTRPRVAVLEAVYTNPHADTETIFSAVRAGLPDVSRQAVYDVLHALTAAGLVRRIQPSGSVARYESRVGDNHHHVVCRSCGAIADVDCAVGEAPCLTPSDHNGFALDEAEVIYWGLCPDCSEPPASRSHP
jgi:Fe2+ or Zn2+ uptake regulation protein